MLEAARKLVHYTAGRTRADLDQDEIFALGIVRLIEIVGEAASKVTDTTRQRFPEVDWQDAAGMRNRIVHQYFDIDLDRVWDTVLADIPGLIVGLEHVLAVLGGDA